MQFFTHSMITIKIHNSILFQALLISSIFNVCYFSFNFFHGCYLFCSKSILVDCSSCIQQLVAVWQVLRLLQKGRRCQNGLYLKKKIVHVCHCCVYSCRNSLPFSLENSGTYRLFSIGSQAHECYSEIFLSLRDVTTRHRNQPASKSKTWD